MTNRATTTKSHILECACSLFYRHGFARVGVDQIAEAAGITKRTLYNHFQSKDALAAAALAVQNEYILHQVQLWQLEEAADPRQICKIIFEQLVKWVVQSDWKGSGFTRITMELAELPGHPARKASSDHKAALEALLTRYFALSAATEATQLARRIIILIEGGMSLALIHADPEYLVEAAKTADSMFDSPAAIQSRQQSAGDMGSSHAK